MWGRGRDRHTHTYMHTHTHSDGEIWENGSHSDPLLSLTLLNLIPIPSPSHLNPIPIPSLSQLNPVVRCSKLTPASQRTTCAAQTAAPETRSKRR